VENRALSIGDLAARAGTKVQTIRYYEQIALVPAPERSAGNQRRYGASHLERLAFIRHARELGFSLGAIRELLGLSDRPDQPCAAVDQLARVHLLEVERRIARLSKLRSELERMIAQCEGGQVRDCRIIEVLSEHPVRPARAQ
jgi:DNA-binding transcriptional MerR regulator